MIHDIWNPSHREIREWAYSGAGQPHPHWALTLNDLNNLPLLIELAGDEACPAQSFFLNCLYVLTQQTLNKGNFHELARLETALEHLETTEQFEEVNRWIKYSRELLAMEAISGLKGWTAEWDSGRSYDRWNQEA